MDIAVIIPCYNSAAWVGETVESVLRQTVPPAEIIVVNDGSTDGSRELLRRYEPHIRVVDQANQGLSGARNAGARTANSPWLTFLDADDLYETSFVHSIAQLHTTFPQTRLLFTDCCVFVGTTTTIQSVMARYVPDIRDRAEQSSGEMLLFGDAFARLLVSRNGAFPPSTMVVHRELFARVGGFYEGLRGTQDLDFYVHAAPQARTGVVLRTLLRKRQHAANMSWQHATMRHDVEIFWQRASAACGARHPELFPVIRQKYQGLLSSWGWHEYRLGLYSQARTTFARAARFDPLRFWNWYGLAAATLRHWSHPST